ncbi:GAF domain-containing protein [Streptomyces sp. NPDC058665]|uniref:GAF domain-containing protein n=1 Tax=Streptomyces sp. NPDC058665 TaxID=3346586 RepID=UPI00365107B9
MSTDMSPSVLNAIFNSSPIGIAVWDRDLRCVWFNSSDTNEGVYKSKMELGRHITDVVATNHPVFLETALRHVLERGLPLLDHELDPSTIPSPDAQPPRFSVSFFRLDDAEGRAVGVCSMAVNIKDSRARQRLNMLSEAGTRIGTTLDPLNTAQELASTAVPALADYATVDLAEVVALGQEPLNHLNSTDISIPVFYRAGAESIHSDMCESLWHRGEPVFVPPASPFTAVLESRRSHFEPLLDTTPGTWLDNDPDRARVIRATGMHSLMIVPLQARGAVLGVAVFVRTENQAPFTMADLALVEGLSDRAALSLDNAIRYTREREVALALQ